MYLLADCYTNYNQDIDAALRMLDAVADANRIARIPILFKSECLHRNFALDCDYTEQFWGKDGTKSAVRFHDLIAAKVVPLEDYARILDAAKERGLSMVMSVYDVEGAQLASEHGAALKIASSNITHGPLIRRAADLSVTDPPRLGQEYDIANAIRPLYIDTGRATLGEVETAIHTAIAAGAPVVRVGISPDGHPALPGDHNLRSISLLRRAFGLQVGMSCHLDGEDAAIAAVAMGADFIEKSICIDPAEQSQDTSISLPIHRLADFANRLADVEEMRGNSWRDMAKPIPRIGSSARMGLVAAQDIEAGEPLRLDAIDYAFPDADHHPSGGIPVAHVEEVIGARVTRRVDVGQPIRWEEVGR